MKRSNPARPAILAVLVSAKSKGVERRLAECEAALARRRVEVVGTLVQRRGVSRGGVASMNAPMSAATFSGSGKTRELAQLAQERNARVLYLLNRISATLLARVSEAIECRVLSLVEDAEQEDGKGR